MRLAIDTLLPALAFVVAAFIAVPAQAEDLSAGAFTNEEYNVDGMFRFFEEDGRIVVELSDDFRTRRGPDLKLFLSPLAADDVTGANATDGSLRIAELDSNRGGQRYVLPQGTDLGDYRSLVIHCEQFSKLWAAGDL